MKLTALALALALSLVLVPVGAAFADTGGAGAATVGQRDVIQEAKDFLQRLGVDITTVEQMLGQATAGRDVVKVLCLTDAKNQLVIIRRTADGRFEQLMVAFNASDWESVQLEFGVLEELDGQAATVMASAQECVGEDLGLPGEFDRKIFVDLGIPEVDVDQLAGDLWFVIWTSIASPVL